jgi:hypothetical protein
MNTSAPTAISETINELRKAAERERVSGATDGRCSRCNGSGFEIVEGKGARKCDHVINDVDQLRERVAIEVEHLPDAPAEVDRRTR